MREREREREREEVMALLNGESFERTRRREEIGQTVADASSASHCFEQCDICMS